MPRPGSGRSDYAEDLARLDQQRDEIRLGRDTNGGTLSAGSERETRLLYNRFQRASLMGDLTALSELHARIVGYPDLLTRHADLCLLKAYIEVKLHRFREAAITLRAHPSLERCREARLVRADVNLQLGRYADARAEVQAALADDAAWDALVRLAHFEHMVGNADAADAFFAEAEDELTAKQMRTFAWIEVQRASVNSNRGRHDEALAQCERAARAYSGYWLVQECIAETLGAMGRFPEALEIYERLHAAVPRPEWKQAIGDLMLLHGDPAASHAWKSRCLDQYLESTARGEVHFYSHLVDLCCELPGRTREAVRWAREDEGLRSNFATQAELAWALCRDSEPQEALLWIRIALDSGAASARLFTQAACIHAAVGLHDAAVDYIRRSTGINPSPAKVTLKNRHVGLRRRAPAASSSGLTASAARGRDSS